MTPSALARLLFGAWIGAQFLSAHGAEAPPRVVITGQRAPASVTIKGVRDPSDWIRAESQHLIVYSDSRVEEVVELITGLERLDYMLRVYLKPFLISKARPPKVTLYFRQGLHWEKELGEAPGVARSLRTSCAAGSQLFTFNLEPIWTLNNAVLNDGHLNLGQVYTNEMYAKLFMLRHTDIRGPSWFVTGFANYFSGVRFTDNQMLVGKDGATAYDLLQQIDDGQRPFRLTFAQVLGDRPIDNPDDFYIGWEHLGRVFNLAHYVLSTEENRHKLLRYLELTNNGERPGKAFADVYGLSGYKLDGAMWTYRQARAKVLRVDIPDMPQANMDIVRLSRQEGKFVLAGAILKSCPTPEHGRALLERVRADAAPARAVELAQMTLSRAEIDWGDPRTALPYLASRTARDPDNSEAHYLLGLAHLRLAEQAPDGDRPALRAAALASLNQAAELDPRMPEASYALHRLALSAQDEPDQLAVARAIAAWRYGHDVPAYARSAALAYAWLDDPAGAHNALNTLARFEHDPQGARWANDWLDRLRQGVPRTELLAAMRRAAREGASFKQWGVR